MGEREDIFDKVFMEKLKAFYSFDEGSMTSGDIGYRATQRTRKLAKILLETAIESGRELIIQDHYIDVNGASQAVHHMKRTIHELAHDYRNRGIALDYQIDDRFNRLSARIMGHSTGKEEISSWGGYGHLRTNVFPIKLLQERQQFLKQRLLLLL